MIRGYGFLYGQPSKSLGFQDLDSQKLQAIWQNCLEKLIE
jgi:hypothetical protein